MSEGNLLDQQQQQLEHHQQQSRKLFSSSRDSELELLDTTTETPSPEIRSRSQSVGSAHREALLFFEQHRLFQNSPELDFGKEDNFGDCELRSISSASRTSSPAVTTGGAHHHQYYQSTEKSAVGGGDNKPHYQQRQQKTSKSNLSSHYHLHHNQQQVQHRHKNSGLRQQSDSNLVESSGSAAATAASFLSGAAANGGGGNQTNNSCSFDNDNPRDSSSESGGVRARSQSQGQCGSVRRRQDSCSSVIILSTSAANNKKSSSGESSSGGCANGEQKTSKWLEEIQFTAQYQHYRTNNYASVVSSASSLDKSDGGTGSSGTAAVETGISDHHVKSSCSSTGAHSKKKSASEAERPSSSKAGGGVGSSSSGSSSHHRHQFTKSCNDEGVVGEKLQHDPEETQPQQQQQRNQEEYINSDNLNRQNSITTQQCWNFPRVKLRKLFTAKSLDDILGGGRSRSAGSASGSSSGSRSKGRKKSLQVAAGVSSSPPAREEFAQEEVSGERSSSSPEFIIRSSTTSHIKKAQLLRDNKLSLSRFQQHNDKGHLLLVKQDGSKSPGAHSSKSAIVISSTAPVSKQQQKGPVFIKANRQKSRSFSALTSALLSRAGHSSSSANSPCSSTASTGSSSGLGIFFKRSHQDNKSVPPVVPPKKSGQVVPCAKSDNCLNRIVASATCAKFVDYFSAENSAKTSSKSVTSTSTLVEPFLQQQQQQSSSDHRPGSASSSTYSSVVVTAQPRKWTAIKNKWDQKLQASGDRQKEIGASLASVSNNAQIFRKTHHHHHQPRQRSNSLSPLDNPEDGKSSESLLEITSPSPTLQEVRFLDTPEIRYASPIAVRSSRGEYTNLEDDDDDEDDNNEDESVTLIEGAIIAGNVITTAGKDSRASSRASSACSSYTVSSFCSDCKDNDINLEDEETDTVGEMTRHHGNAGAIGVGGTKRSRDHHHHHHRHHGKHHHSGTKEKPKLVVANVTYLQRPMSPGLVLRESSPSSSATGTVESFCNLPGGNPSGVGNLSSTSAIRNNNVFTNNNNNQSSALQQQSKSQQAKLEFLKSVSTPQQQSFEIQQNTFGSDPSRKRDPLCANNTSIINANERQVSSGVVDVISPSSSSGGASDNRSSSSVGVGIIGTNNVTVGRRNIQQGTILSSHHPQQYLYDDLQQPVLTNRQRDHFTDSGVRSGTGDNLAGGSAGGIIKGHGGVSGGANKSKSSRGAPSDDDEKIRRSQQPTHYRGAEHCSNLSRTDPHSSDRHHPHQGAIGSGSGEGAATYGARSSDNQSSEAGDTGGQPPGTPGGRGESSAPINQDPQTLAQQQSSINNNLFIDVDFEGTDDTMGDLQSPQYVKRTAHMFDSRFSTEPGANGHERNGRNPSYLNVSRSVSGYSCMTYNNGSVTSETVTNKSVLGNGASLLTSGTRVTSATPRLKTDFSLHSPFTRNKVPNTDDDSSDHSSNQSATSPPPSLPPINTTSSHGRYSDSPFFQNEMNRGEDLMDTPYIPSHGKSFIMQRIERLYGSDAVSNKGVLTRKSSASHVTTISITRESPTRGNERIIPIQVESRDDHQNNLYNNGCVSNKNEISMEDDDNTISCTKSAVSTGVIIPIIRSNEENSHRVVEPRCSIVSVDDTEDDEEDERSTGKMRSPTKSLGHLNGNNANRYSNVEERSTNGNEAPMNGSTDMTLGRLIHTNGTTNHHDQDYTSTKKVLSRESSAGSDDTNECSENSLELGSISSEVESRKSVISRQDSKEDSPYSTRGAISPVKPKPKPKPKDMALLRTLSRSPALKTGTENLDKTAISLSIVQPEVAAAASVSFSRIDDKITVCSEDPTDAENVSTLSDIKNTISATTAAKSLPQGKNITPPLPIDQTSQSTTPSTDVADKENAPSQDIVESGTDSAASTTPIVKDGNYFLNEMKKVTKDILKFSEHAAKELDTIDPSEDRAGSIHAAIGKGNLLVKKKFKQFEGLCHANLKGCSGDEPETTNEDLAGFWDMVLIQVEQIYALFADLEKKEEAQETVPKTPLKSSSPKRLPASTSKATTRTSVGATPRVNSAAAKARDEARRKLLAEKRKAMKNQMQETQEAAAADEPEAQVQIFAPDTPQTG